MKKHPKILTIIPGKSNIQLSMSRSNNTNIAQFYSSESIIVYKNDLKIVVMG